MSTIRASLIKTNNDTKKYVKFYIPYLNQNSSIPKVIKPNYCKPSPSLTLVEYFKNHELIIQEEINDEHSDKEVINFDEESNEESEIELKINLVAQKLINAYPYQSDREKEIKEIEVRKIISTKSYQQAQLCVRKVIMRELERQLIQEWREQNGRFTLKTSKRESEEEIEEFNFLENR